MNQRRALYQRFEQRLREREIDAEQLWGSLQVEAGEADPALGYLITSASRRITWALWEMVIFEAMDVIAEVEADHQQHENSVSPWLCQSCKRRLLRVVGRDGDAEFEDLAG